MRPHVHNNLTEGETCTCVHVWTCIQRTTSPILSKVVQSLQSSQDTDTVTANLLQVNVHVYIYIYMLVHSCMYLSFTCTHMSMFSCYVCICFIL